MTTPTTPPTLADALKRLAAVEAENARLRKWIENIGTLPFANYAIERQANDFLLTFTADAAPEPGREEGES